MVWKVEIHDGLRYFLWTCDKETYSGRVYGVNNHFSCAGRTSEKGGGIVTFKGIIKSMPTTTLREQVPPPLSPTTFQWHPCGDLAFTTQYPDPL